MITLTWAGGHASQQPKPSRQKPALDFILQLATFFIRLHYSTIKKFMRHKKPRTLLRGDEVWAIHEPQGVSA